MCALYLRSNNSPGLRTYHMPCLYDICSTGDCDTYESLHLSYLVLQYYCNHFYSVGGAWARPVFAYIGDVIVTLPVAPARTLGGGCYLIHQRHMKRGTRSM